MYCLESGKEEIRRGERGSTGAATFQHTGNAEREGGARHHNRFVTCQEAGLFPHTNELVTSAYEQKLNLARSAWLKDQQKKRSEASDALLGGSS